jgi:hypothetical protein
MVAKLLLAFTTTVILGSKSHGTHDHNLLTDEYGSHHCLFWFSCRNVYMCIMLLAITHPSRRQEIIAQELQLCAEYTLCFNYHGLALPIPH